jgi:hypothetical protein
VTAVEEMERCQRRDGEMREKGIQLVRDVGTIDTKVERVEES